jgi:hypothetical protein
MRTFSEGRLARSVAYLLTAAFGWSAGLVGLTCHPAGAQVVTRAATSQSVAVVPFENRSSFRPETFGDEASAAVTTELRDRLLVDVLPKADVVLQMRTLGLQVPLSKPELIRLASELDVALLASGEVRGARVLSGPEGRYGEVVLAVRLFDSVAKVDTNGALVVGKGPASPDASDEVLLDKALQQAAFEAVELMKSRPTIAAMVLWTRGDIAYLNVGARGGLRPGMQLAAVRGGERIGLVEVDQADALGAYVRVVQGPPLRTGDQLRAVYVLPPDAGPELAVTSGKKKKTFESMVILGAVLLGFGQYASRSRRLGEGDTAAPNFQASNLANGAEIGASGYGPSIYPTRDWQPHPAALITWEGYQGTEVSRLVGYEIRRSYSMMDIVAILVFEFGETYWLFDSNSFPSFVTAILEIDEGSGGVASYDTEVEVWDPGDWDPETGEFDNPWGDFFEDWADDAGIFVTRTSIEWGWFPSMLPGDEVGGMFPQVFYQYTIKPILVQRDRNGFWYIDHGTEFSTSPNQVVGVAPAFTPSAHYVFAGMNGPYEIWDTMPNPQVLGNTATFFFYYPFGADEIVLQVSRDPNVRFAPPAVANFSVPPQLPDPGQIKSNFGIDLSLVPGVGGLFWWRIGARNSADTRLARTFPIGDLNDSGFVWSPRNAFQITAVSRAELMHKQREALSAARAAAARVPRAAATDRVLRAE